MKYDFGKKIERRDTYCIKYDMAGRGKPEDVLPMWVADMDIQTPPCVIEALVEQCRHGIYGYSDINDAYFESVAGWMARRFGWKVEKDWLVITPGIVTAIYLAIRALTNEGDGVLIQQPVYYPFKESICDQKREIVVNQLINDGEKYIIDYDDFEQKIIDNKVKLFILCNPHNPGGRVWTKEELRRLGEICLRHNVYVISDEIHQDFIYKGHKHQVFVEVDPAFADVTITCTAPSKTFNLASLMMSNIFIANKEIRDKFKHAYRCAGMSQLGVMGIVSCKAAYDGGEDWLEQLIEYLEGNISYIREYLAKNLPQIKMMEPQGSYLVWLDFSAMGMNTKELNDFITNKAKLWLNCGTIFGAGGEGFQRINVACPRETVIEAMERLNEAVKAL